MASELSFCDDHHKFYKAMEGMHSYGYTQDDLLNGVRKNDMFESPQAKKEKSIYISIFYDLSFTFMDKSKQEISAPEEVILAYVERTKKEPIYRIRINDDGTVDTDCYEMMDSFQPELEGGYDNVDELPKWVQDRISVLMLLDHKVLNQEVKSVGRRISENIFWVFKGEQDGDDPRG